MKEILKKWDWYKLSQIKRQEVHINDSWGCLQTNRILIFLDLPVGKRNWLNIEFWFSEVFWFRNNRRCLQLRYVVYFWTFLKFLYRTHLKRFYSWTFLWFFMAFVTYQRWSIHHYRLIKRKVFVQLVAIAFLPWFYFNRLLLFKNALHLIQLFFNVIFRFKMSVCKVGIVLFRIFNLDFLQPLPFFLGHLKALLFLFCQLVLLIHDQIRDIGHIIETFFEKVVGKITGLFRNFTSFM